MLKSNSINNEQNNVWFPPKSQFWSLNFSFLQAPKTFFFFCKINYWANFRIVFSHSDNQIKKITKLKFLKIIMEGYNWKKKLITKKIPNRENSMVLDSIDVFFLFFFETQLIENKYTG